MRETTPIDEQVQDDKDVKASPCILIADDDVIVRNLVRQVLQSDGYGVLVAADGAEAVELSQTHKGSIDLILTDVMMPAVDGITAYRLISKERPGTKVLFMSGGTSGSLKLPQALPFLPKPFKLEILRAKVNDILLNTPPVEDLKVILIVDHNDKRMDRTKHILSDNGYAVLTAKSVDEAEAVSNSVARIDLIVSGVVFPGRSGVQLAEHIAASERDINTLLISHFHPDVLRNVEGFSSQPEFLQNPFTAEDLLARVRTLLEQ